jgi:hypothetical protein
MTKCERAPEAPVTVTVKDPAADELTVSVEVSVPPGLRGTLVVLRLAAGLLAARVTTPLKPLTLISVRIVLFE